MTKRIQALIIAALLTATSEALAQSPSATPTLTPTTTDTPTLTPTNTNTPSKTPTPTAETVPTPPNSDHHRLVALFSGRTTVGASGGVWVGPFPNKSVEVCVDADCQSFRLQIETSNAPPNWVTAMVPSSAILSEGAVPAGTCLFYRFTSADAWVRANLLADNTCSVTATLNASR